MLTYLITFFAVFVTDILYVYFVKSIQNDRPLATAWWSMVVTFKASVSVINYTQDHWALIPALLGAFFGAYVGMKVKKKWKCGRVWLIAPVLKTDDEKSSVSSNLTASANDKYVYE